MPPNLSKRIVSGILGVLSFVACYCMSNVAVEEMISHFKYRYAFSWLFELTMCLMALASFAVCLSFMRFAWTGTEFRLGGSLRPLLLGAGLFIPGFSFSLPLVVFLGEHFAPVSQVDVMVVSFCIGVATSIVGSVLLLRRQRRRKNIP